MHGQCFMFVHAHDSAMSDTPQETPLPLNCYRCTGTYKQTTTDVIKGCIYAIVCNITRFNALEKWFYISLRLENELNTIKGNCWGVSSTSCLYK